ncbi:MAG: twin-arginine translocase TatA/TatE family subunit [Chloroflexi bacterium]|nr:twin-arginine translocase TatA/TatE family subunit [Chloroflexota bacterium]
MPFNLGLPELIVIMVIVLLVFGAGRLPQVGNAIGKSLREFKRGMSGEGEEKPAPAAQTATQPEPPQITAKAEAVQGPPKKEP